MKQIVQFIEDNNISEEEVAKAAHMSLRNFRRQIHSEDRTQASLRCRPRSPPSQPQASPLPSSHRGDRSGYCRQCFQRTGTRPAKRRRCSGAGTPASPCGHRARRGRSRRP